MADYESLRKAELIELAEQNSVSVSDAMTKAEIIEALESSAVEVEIEAAVEDEAEKPAGWDKAYAHAQKHGNSQKSSRQYADTYFKDFA